MNTKLSQLAALSEQAENDFMLGGIFAPNLGVREDMPSISLSDAFSIDSENVLMRNGEVSRRRLRLPEFNQAVFTTGTVTAANGSDAITASGAGIWGTSATHKPQWVGRKIVITEGSTDYEYTINAINDTGDEITLSSNYEGAGGAGLSYVIGEAGEQVKSPDANPIIHYHRLVKMSTGTEIEYILAFTKAHVYLWDSSWSAFVLKFTCTGDCELWSTQSFDEQVIATNNVDKVQVWGTTTNNAFGNLTGDADGILVETAVYLTKAKCVIEFENRILLLNVTIGGTVYAEQANFSAQDDETNFNVDAAGDAGSMVIRHNVEGGEDYIVGAGKYKSWLIIGKSKSMHYYWLVTNEDIFNGDVLLPNVGLLAMHSMINNKEGDLYWLASDYTFREINAGVVSTARENTFKLINPGYEHLVKTAFITEYGEILLAIPYGPAATGNNKILWYDLSRKIWGDINIAAAAFGSYHRQTSYTIDTIPYDSIDEIGWDSIDSVENMAGFALTLCSDYSGYSYAMHSAQMDAGEEYEGHFTIATDLLEKIMAKRYGATLRQYKRIEFLQIWIAGQEAGTLEISVKRDNEKAFQSLSSISLINEDQDIFSVDINMDVCDLRAKHFIFKISGGNKFTFYGIIIGFLPDGNN